MSNLSNSQKSAIDAIMASTVTNNKEKVIQVLKVNMTDEEVNSLDFSGVDEIMKRTKEQLAKTDAENAELKKLQTDVKILRKRWRLITQMF
jgi:peptidoglycan hydrolase CwlO-like protein